IVSCELPAAGCCQDADRGFAGSRSILALWLADGADHSGIDLRHLADKEGQKSFSGRVDLADSIVPSQIVVRRNGNLAGDRGVVDALKVEAKKADAGPRPPSLLDHRPD